MRSVLRPGGAALACVVLAVAIIPAHASLAATDDGPPPTVRIVAAEAGPLDEAARAVEAMTLAEKAAAVVMGHIATTEPAVVRDYMTATGIGGFILMGANVPPTEQELRALTDALVTDPALPPLIAVDEEGGDVRRLPWDGFPGADTLRAAPPEATEDAFAGRAALVERAGIGVNFGVVADVEDAPSSFIYRRAFGSTPEATAERVVGAVNGEAPSAISTLKHFPGHGAPDGDSHTTLPETGISLEEWSATHAVPFRAGIDAGAPMLMFGHLRYTAVDQAPASLSAEWHRIARESLGFEGVIVTDDLGMLQASGAPEYADPVANAVAALRAGSDMVLTVMFTTADSAAQLSSGIAAAVEAGDLSAERLDEAATRVTALRLTRAADPLLPCGDCAPVP